MWVKSDLLKQLFSKFFALFSRTSRHSQTSKFTVSEKPYIWSWSCDANVKINTVALRVSVFSAEFISLITNTQTWMFLRNIMLSCYFYTSVKSKRFLIFKLLRPGYMTASALKLYSSSWGFKHKPLCLKVRRIMRNTFSQGCPNFRLLLYLFWGIILEMIHAVTYSIYLLWYLFYFAV